MTDANPNEIPTNPKRRSPAKPWSIGPILIAACCLALIPIFFYGCPGERDRWAAARLIEHYLDGDHQGAIQSMQRLVDQNPGELRLQLILSQWYLDEMQFGAAMELVEPIYREYPDWPSARDLYQYCLMSLGREDEALDIYKQAYRFEQLDGDSLLRHKNALSYFRALAFEDIDSAVEDIHFVTSEMEKRWNQQIPLPLSVRSQSAFCSAKVYQYLYENMGHESIQEKTELFGRAIDFLNGQVALLSARHVDMLDIMRRGTADLMAVEFPLQGRPQQQLLTLRGQVDLGARELAVFLTLRAKLLQLHSDFLNRQVSSTNPGGDQTKIGPHLAQSFRDRMFAERLGFDCEELINRFPDIDYCSRHLLRLTQYLDTRGCVYFVANQLQNALADLNVAVAGQEAMWIAGAQLPIANSEPMTDERLQREQFERLPRKILAVLLFHRSWVQRALKNSGAANQDVSRIRQLGYAPGKHLF